MNNSELQNLAHEYRKELFEKFVKVGQGHPGSTFSMVEIATTLYHGGFVRPEWDRVLISKGHATVTLYPILTKLGIIPQKDWDSWGSTESCLRVFGNISIPGIDVTSGSLGHGIGVGLGMSMASMHKEYYTKNVYVVISEGELYEGSTWEALLFASHHKPKNLTIFIDINNLIILGKTKDCVNLEPIKDKIEGFGFDIYDVDGHDVGQIKDALDKKTETTKVILARTVKGKGFSLMENQPHWHYMNKMSEEEIEQCRKEINNVPA